MKKNWRVGLLLSVVFGLAFYLWSRPPLPQALAYHNFGDQRTFFSIPHFFDVISNLPFLFVGVWGLSYCRKHRQQAAPLAWQVFFGGVTLVSAGSAYYHWNPNNTTLIWDRLPMTIGFMGLFVALLSEYIEPKLERWLLFPMMLLGFASVLVWAQFDDLRFYAWIQAAPLLAILVLLIVFPAPTSHKHLLFFSLLSYILAKVTESHDKTIFSATGQLLSGHTIKHLLAGLGVLWLFFFIKMRVPRKTGTQTDQRAN